MKRMITIAFMMTVVIDPMTQIDEGLQKAKAEGKFVIRQGGGNWCPWCLRFADFVEKDTAVNKAVNDNFVYLHVNYNPRKKEGDASVEKAAQLMKRLNYPQRFGFPVFVVLDEEWKCSPYPGFQLPEQGKGYDEQKTLRFLKNWTPKAVK